MHEDSTQVDAPSGTESPTATSGKHLATSARRMLKSIGSRGNLRSMFSSSDSAEANQPPNLSLEINTVDDDFISRSRSPSSPVTINEDLSSGPNSEFLRDSESSDFRGSDSERKSGKSKHPQQHWLRNMIAKNKLEEAATKSRSPNSSPRAAEARNLAAVKVPPPPEIRMSRDDSYDSGKRSPQGLEPVLEHQETSASQFNSQRSPSNAPQLVLQKSRSPGVHDALGRQSRFPASPLGSPNSLGSDGGGGRKRASSVNPPQRNSSAGGNELSLRRSLSSMSRPRSGSSERGGLPRTYSASSGLKRTQSAYSNSSAGEGRGRERSHSVERSRPSSATGERPSLQRTNSSNSIRPPFRRRASNRAHLSSATRRRTHKYSYATPEDRAAAKVQALARAILARTKIRRRRLEYLLEFEGEMRQGRNLVKHPRSGNPRAVNVVLSKVDGMSALSWGGRGHVFISDMTYVRVGIHTPVLTKRANPLEPEWYFSIFTADRTLDIETQSAWSSYYYKVGFTLLIERHRQRAPEESNKPSGRKPLLRFLSRRDPPRDCTHSPPQPSATPPTPMSTPVMNLVKKPAPPPETPQTSKSSESGVVAVSLDGDEDDDGTVTPTSSIPDPPVLTSHASDKVSFDDLPNQRATVNLTQMNSQLQSLRDQARDSFDGTGTQEEREQAFFDSLVKASRTQAKQEFRTEREKAIYKAVESANRQREREKSKFVQERSQQFAKGTAEQIIKSNRRKSEAIVSPARARIAQSRRRSLEGGTQSTDLVPEAHDQPHLADA